MHRSLFVLCLALVGCPKSPGAGVAPEVLDAVVRVDAAWEARASEGLEASEQALTELPPTLRAAPEIRWREARLRVAQGITADSPLVTRRAYARARGAAMACLADDPRIERARAGRRLARALEVAPARRLPCAAWAGYAWARWLTSLEAGAVAVDLQAARALLERGLEADDPRSQEVARWGLALLSSDAGSSLAELARADTVDAWVRYEDARRLAPRQDVPPPQRPPASPEERAAAERVGHLTPPVEPGEEEEGPGAP